jgi:ABC-type cobalt transport system substrate-binding protein
MSNKSLLTIIVVILIGIFATIFIETTHETPMEEFTGNVNEAIEEVQDEIDDSTTN